MLSKDAEKEYLLDEIARKIKKAVPYLLCGVDTRDADDVDCEIFQVYFILNKNCGDEIDANNVDGNIVLFNLINQAVELIKNRIVELEHGNHREIVGVGILSDTEWSFGLNEIPEFEAMIGFVPNENDLPVRWTFPVRFVADNMFYTGRCVSKKVEISDKDFEIIKSIANDT